jgi:hypothetical protein
MHASICGRWGPNWVVLEASILCDICEGVACVCNAECLIVVIQASVLNELAQCALC